MIEFDRNEALRYLGYRNTEPDAAIAESLTRCAADMQAAVQPKSVFVSFPLSAAPRPAYPPRSSRNRYLYPSRFPIRRKMRWRSPA